MNEEDALNNCCSNWGDGEKWGWWEERSLPQKVIIGIGLGIIALAAAAFLFFLFGWIVMSLWNYLMPEIFGLPTISYWQGWGLLVLSSILFKDFSSGDSSGKRTDRKRKKTLRKYIKTANFSNAEETEKPEV